MTDERGAGNLLMLGGLLCLDFANTVEWRLGDRPEDLLASYADLVAWSRHVGILSDSQARRLLKESGRSPAPAGAAFRRAIALREVVYRIFSRIAQGESPARADLGHLNSTLSCSLPHMRLVSTQDAFQWGWEESTLCLERPLWHIAYSAAVLLTTGDLSRVGQCSDERCGWLYFDRSKNGSRRWCSMEDCGNRAKARRHYKRTKTGVKQKGKS